MRSAVDDRFERLCEDGVKLNRPLLGWEGEGVVILDEAAAAETVRLAAAAGVCARKPQPARKAIMLTVVM